ncbi:rpa-interacting protein rpain [Anaeramoeba flamelloides]|uniref:Rpa-interacting protein rpain n=1 Tax=Anaeramoeba flamelloides TaxID=1746091 RepID=A0ABQ8YS75_9EUKA|nr:rpa-interacting protein rpain [Anaeramoeba flamelloides]
MLKFNFARKTTTLQRNRKKRICKDLLLTKCLERARSDRQNRFDKLRNNQLKMLGIINDSQNGSEEKDQKEILIETVNTIEQTSQKLWPEMIQNVMDQLETTATQEDFQEILIALEQEMISERENFLKILQQQAEEFQDYETEYTEYLISTLPEVPNNTNF